MQSTIMQTAPPVSRQRLWGGRILTALAVLFLLMDSVMKFTNLPAVLEATTRLGLSAGLLPGLGILLLTCTVLYAIPQTSILGAILLTGYLGGAVATHLRIGDPLFSHVLFPVYLGVLIWGGLLLRDSRLRALVPLRS